VSLSVADATPGKSTSFTGSALLMSVKSSATCFRLGSRAHGRAPRNHTKDRKPARIRLKAPRRGDTRAVTASSVGSGRTSMRTRCPCGHSPRPRSTRSAPTRCCPSTTPYLGTRPKKTIGMLACENQEEEEGKKGG
jgi:hypothetical protein